jgi:hypothetical protein
MTALIVMFERCPTLDEVRSAFSATGLLASPATQGLALRGAAGPVDLSLVDEPLGDSRLGETALHSRWQAAAAAIDRHRGYARLFPTDADEGVPLERLQGLTRLAAVLLAMPGALSLYAERGSALTDAGEALRRIAASPSTPPVELWMGVRSFEVADARGFFLDTLGMGQLGLPDLEAYAAEGAGAEEVAAWLRNLSLYLVQEGTPARLRHGDTLDGPDELPWRTVEDVATVEPARPVLRFVPVSRQRS